jgi:hypothetical protein
MNSQRTSPVILAIAWLIAASMVVASCNSILPLAPTQTPTTRPETLVKAYEDAFNQHDLAAVMDLLSEKVSINLVGWTDQARSGQEARDLNGMWFAMNFEMHYSNCKTTGTMVYCNAVASVDCSKAAGMNGINFSNASFEINNNKIDQIVMQMQADDEKTYRSFLNHMEQWMNEVQPGELEKTDIINQESGTIYSSLCREYAALNLFRFMHRLHRN